MNCPCFYDQGYEFIKNNPNVYCPGDNLILKKSDSKIALTRERDLVIISNSWGTISAYHTISDVLFSLYVTIWKFQHSFNITIKTITFLNLSPNCNSEPHEIRLKPYVEALYGDHSYENTTGSLSNTFNNSNNSSTYFKYLIYGLHYVSRPYTRDYNQEAYHYSKDIGTLYRHFADDLFAKILQNRFKTYADFGNNISSISLHVIDRKKIGMDDRAINKNLFDELFREMNMNVTFFDFGRGSLISIEKQAQFTSEMKVLIGTEGAGFANQVFMPYNSILIILHLPKWKSNFDRRPLGEYGNYRRNRWHEATAVFLDMSVLNIQCSISGIRNKEVIRKIILAIFRMIELHVSLSKQRLIATCDLDQIDHWDPQKNFTHIRIWPFHFDRRREIELIE